VSIPNLGAFDVISSADLKAAVTRAVEARTFSNGQSCIAAKRFIVAELIADEFEGKFVKRIQDLKSAIPSKTKKTVAVGAWVLIPGLPFVGPVVAF
jgi:acyl-CoA reductase-like NAD-dependent aldehyde dehydrogenase